MIIFTVLGVLMVVAAAYIFIPRAAFIVCVATIVIPKINTSFDPGSVAIMILVVFAVAVGGLIYDLKIKV